MKPLSVFLYSATVVCGLAGAAVAYSAATLSPEAATSTQLPVPTTAEAPPLSRGTKFAWAPCTPPAKLEGDVCVTDVVRTVVVPTPEAAVVPAAVPRAPVPYAEDREDDSDDDSDDSDVDEGGDEDEGGDQDDGHDDDSDHDEGGDEGGDDD